MSPSETAQQEKNRGAPDPDDRTPRPPFPPQHQDPPGEEAKLEPRPRYQAPRYRGSDKLQDRVALITGGDSGIGRSVAVLYAREGADVAIVHVAGEERDAEETRRVIEAEGRRALILTGDVADPTFCREAVERTVRELGRLDILVNNAAYQQHKESVEEIDDTEWEHTFRVNVHGTFFLTRAALQHLPRGGSIINSGSQTGLVGSKHLLDYSATKGAIHALTKSLAQNLLDRGIRVNCVAPGPVWTPLNPSDLSARDTAHFGEGTPMQRPAQPEEIAPAYVYFASETDSSYVSGEILGLLGGRSRSG